MAQVGRCQELQAAVASHERIGGPLYRLPVPVSLRSPEFFGHLFLLPVSSYALGTFAGARGGAGEHSILYFGPSSVTASLEAAWGTMGCGCDEGEIVIQSTEVVIV